MVKNREELLQVAKSNADQLKNHLRRAISSFLTAQHASPDELAYVLGITNAEMRQILEGDGNITVNALSKLLVATDMAVEIKPVINTPLGAYGPKMPRSGGFPCHPDRISGGPDGIPVGPDGRPLPPPPGWPCPEFMHSTDTNTRIREERAVNHGGTPRDEHGRFKKKEETATRRMATSRTEHEIPYMAISDADLANIIRQNIWDGEIDINNASHAELAQFVENKERIMRQRTQSAEARPTQKEEEHIKPSVSGGGDSLSQFLEMLGNVAKEAKNNPQLMETISRFMPK